MKFLAILLLSLLFAASCVEIQLTKGHGKSGHHAGHRAAGVILGLSVSKVKASAACRAAGNAIRALGKKGKSALKRASKAINHMLACAKLHHRKRLIKRLKRAHHKKISASKKKAVKKAAKKHTTKVKKIKTAGKKALTKKLQKKIKKHSKIAKKAKKNCKEGCQES